MGSGIVLLNIFSLLIIVILSIVFFTKQRLHKNEDNLYGKLLVYSVFANIFGILFGLLMETEYLNSIITLIFNKIYLIFLIIIVLTFAFYTFCISKRSDKYFIEAKVVYYVMIVTSIILLMTLPVQLVNINGVLSISGPAFYFTVLDFIIIYTCLIILLLLDYKHIYSKKYIPIILLLIGGIIIAAVQMIMPNANYIINPSIAITILIMYFTIENPDMKMMEELYKNKRIIESNAESTSNFLFKLSQDMKSSVNEINLISSKKSNEDLKKINVLGKNLKHIINDTLDMSTMVSKPVKIYNSKYNPKNLFDEVMSMTENKLKNNVKLEYNLCSNMPHYVYGDFIKVKQILSSILENSIKYTKEGFISFDVNTIIKYDTCRFIIDITDSGEGLSLDKVNEILSLDALPEESDLDKIVLDLIEVRSLVNQIGGSFMIKSEKNEGTMVNIVLDQKIYETNNKNKDINKELTLYENALNKGSNIMVVDDDAKELSDIKKYLENRGMQVSGSLYGMDIIQKLNENYKFDLIILDDETNTGSALSILQKLKENDKFNVPVIVMINDNKEIIKNQYLKDGFTDIIKKSDLKKELDRIVNEKF